VTEDRGITEPDSEHPQESAGEQPRAYVGLLTEVMTNTLDEDYATVAEKRRRTGVTPPTSAGTRMALLGAIAVFGVLIGVSALKTDQDRPETEAERAELIAQIQKRQDDQEALSRAINAVGDDVTELQSAVGDEVSRNTSIVERLETLGVSAGTLAVSGPGMEITVDDAPADQAGTGGVILDTDLQSLANALWMAGAEAVSIDGHRLTSLTAIRFAGEAITVDNVSLTPPYDVVAIGDPDTLPARLLETPGGQTWLGLQANFGITFDRVTKDDVTVPADPHEHLLYAKPEGTR
jgi:uncharacterized protein YlxW (UPF0749 family)